MKASSCQPTPVVSVSIARRPESIIASRSTPDHIITAQQIQLHKWLHHKLCNLIATLNKVRFLTHVTKDNLNLTTILGINDTGRIEYKDTMLRG
jgi:hypothetical protein